MGEKPGFLLKQSNQLYLRPDEPEVCTAPSAAAGCDCTRKTDSFGIRSVEGQPEQPTTGLHRGRARATAWPPGFLREGCAGSFHRRQRSRSARPVQKDKPGHDRRTEELRAVGAGRLVAAVSWRFPH